MPTPAVVVRAPIGAEFDQLADVIHQSFAGFNQPFEATTRWMNHVGRENLRVVVQRRRVVAGLGILYFGHFFGGRSVPAAGITCVGVAPEVRGTGVGTALMQSVVSEFATRGIPLSSLYPSTYALYRKAGYEPAGARIRYKLNLATLGVADRAWTIRALDKSEYPAMRALYARIAPCYPGRVERTDREWRRILELGEARKYIYGVSRDGGRALDGYIVYEQAGATRERYRIEIRDLCAANIGAIRRLLAFLGDHQTMAGPVNVETGSAEPWLTMAREEWLEVENRILWMLRVVNVPAALVRRGYSAAVRGELHLQVEDPLISANKGRFVLRVEDGKARVRRGGCGRLRADIRGLAPLFSGHLSAEQLAICGLLDGSPGELALASALFAGPAPGMGERF
ncbi:MAG: GNAT family N-acetyltransferase [Planctomycetes bacterium]|nr:GNAT family N-acetyltransferase [Planctomycetota bacterium]